MRFAVDQDYSPQTQSVERVAQDFALLHRLGIRILRTGIGWDDTNPKPDVYRWHFWSQVKSHAAQELESYPLDSMTMVGSLQQGGKAHALIMVESRLHDVKVGDWIGQNYGQITAITDSQITLRETVQDPTGEWIERTSTLQIQEKAR